MGLKLTTSNPQETEARPVSPDKLQSAMEDALRKMAAKDGGIQPSEKAIEIAAKVMIKKHNRLNKKE